MRAPTPVGEVEKREEDMRSRCFPTTEESSVPAQARANEAAPATPVVPTSESINSASMATLFKSASELQARLLMHMPQTPLPPNGLLSPSIQHEVELSCLQRARSAA